MPPVVTAGRLAGAIDGAQPRDRLRTTFVCLLAASGSFVFIEPAPYDVLAIGMFVGLLASGLQFPTEIRAHVVLLAVFVAGNVVAAAASPEPAETIRSLAIRIYLPVTWLLFVGLVVTNPRRILTALWIGYLIAAVSAVVWGILEYFGVLDVGELRSLGVKAVGAGMRARGAFKDPNVFGPFLVPAAVFAASRVAYGRRLDRAFFAILLLMFLFGILLSFSRGAWMNCTVALLVFAFLAYRAAARFKDRVAWLILGTVSVLVMLTLLAGVLSFGTIADRFYQRAVLIQEYDVGSGGRFDTQRRALSEIGVNPLGVGPGRADEEFGLVPHNLFLHVLVEGGWVGGLCFAAFVALCLLGIARATWRPSQLGREAMVVFSSLCGILVQSPFIDSTHWRHLWLFLALSAALAIAIRREQRVPLHLQGATIR